MTTYAKRMEKERRERAATFDAWCREHGAAPWQRWELALLPGPNYPGEDWPDRVHVEGVIGRRFDDNFRLHLSPRARAAVGTRPEGPDGCVYPSCGHLVRKLGDVPRTPILAIDPATRLGWALFGRDGQVTSGAVQLGQGSAAAARIVDFDAWIQSRMRPLSWGRGVLAYEEPVARFRGHMRVAAHLEAVALLTARRQGVAEILTASPTDVKSHATGDSRASKDAVVAAMRERWGRPDLEDDNEADALALLSLVLEQRTKEGSP